MTTRTTKSIARNNGNRASPPCASAEVAEDRIRARAYEIYLARGERPGDALSDWYQAERELGRSAGPRGRRRDGKEKDERIASQGMGDSVKTVRQAL